MLSGFLADSAGPANSACYKQDRLKVHIERQDGFCLTLAFKEPTLTPFPPALSRDSQVEQTVMHGLLGQSVLSPHVPPVVPSEAAVATPAAAHDASSPAEATAPSGGDIAPVLWKGGV